LVPIVAPEPTEAVTVALSLAVAAAPSPETTPPATAVALADCAPLSAASTATAAAPVMVVPLKISAVTELDFSAVATEAPMAATPPAPPPVVLDCVEVSVADTMIAGGAPLAPTGATEPPSSAVTTLLTLLTPTAASAPK
jgi:hypothetical protein